MRQALPDCLQPLSEHLFCAFLGLKRKKPQQGDLLRFFEWLFLDDTDNG